jgi:AcrR family transcriptional regulator
LTHPDTPAPARAENRRQRLSGEQRQREIVSTVLELARDHGPDAITTHAIAERMGVTQGALFRHFPDKQAIWLAVFAWVREALGARLDEAMRDARSPLAALARAFEAHVTFVAEHPGVPRILFHELQYPAQSAVRTEVRAMVLGYRKRLKALFVEARARREVSASLDLDLAPVLFIGAVQGLVIQAALNGNDRAAARRARAAFALLLEGFRGSRGRA